MFDLEANKSIALRLVEVFNGRRLDLLEHVLHPEFRGRGILSLPAGQALSESSTRCSIKRSPTRGPRCSTLSRKATGRARRSLRWYDTRGVPGHSRHRRSHQVDGE